MPRNKNSYSIGPSMDKKIRKNMIETARRLASYEREKTEPKLVSTALTICKQNENYFIEYKDLFLKNSNSLVDTVEMYKLQFQQYVEAIKSLNHNIVFILTTQNFGSKDKMGKTIDLPYLKNLNFSYSASIRSKFACQTRPRYINDSEDIIPLMIRVLEQSEKIIEDIESSINIAEMSRYIPNVSDTFEKTKEFKAKILNTSNIMIASLKNETITLSKFKDNICLDDMATISFNK